MFDFLFNKIIRSTTLTLLGMTYEIKCYKTSDNLGQECKFFIYQHVTLTPFYSSETLSLQL